MYNFYHLALLHLKQYIFCDEKKVIQAPKHFKQQKVTEINKVS